MVFLLCAVLIDGLIFDHGFPLGDYPGGNDRLAGPRFLLALARPPFALPYVKTRNRCESPHSTHAEIQVEHDNMNNDIDTALEAEVTRRAMALGIQTRLPGRRWRAARLASRLYAGASAVQRSWIVATLLKPLGPLALVAVASGAFAGLLDRVNALGATLPIDELGHFTREQVFELARFVEQVSPDTLQQVAGTITENPFGVSALGAAAAVLLAMGARATGKADAQAQPSA